MSHQSTACLRRRPAGEAHHRLRGGRQPSSALVPLDIQQLCHPGQLVLVASPPQLRLKYPPPRILWPIHIRIKGNFMQGCFLLIGSWQLIKQVVTDRMKCQWNLLLRTEYWNVPLNNWNLRRSMIFLSNWRLVCLMEVGYGKIKKVKRSDKTTWRTVEMVLVKDFYK